MIINNNILAKISYPIILLSDSLGRLKEAESLRLSLISQEKPSLLQLTGQIEIVEASLAQKLQQKREGGGITPSTERKEVSQNKHELSMTTNTLDNFWLKVVLNKYSIFELAFSSLFFYKYIKFLFLAYFSTSVSSQIIVFACSNCFCSFSFNSSLSTLGLLKFLSSFSLFSKIILF